LWFQIFGKNLEFSSYFELNSCRKFDLHANSRPGNVNINLITRLKRFLEKAKSYFLFTPATQHASLGIFAEFLQRSLAHTSTFLHILLDRQAFAESALLNVAYWGLADVKRAKQLSRARAYTELT